MRFPKLKTMISQTHKYDFQVRKSMKMVEEASNCKSCVKVDRKMEDGEVLREEFTTA
jgi:hypothetical protein